MKSDIRIILFFLMLLYGAIAANAVTFTIDFGLAQSVSDTVGVSKGLLVVDTAGDGFTGFGDPDTGLSDLASFAPMSPGTLVNDDMIAAVITVSLIDSFTGYENLTMYDTADSTWGGNLATGQNFALYMFRAGTANGGDPVGFYRSDVITDPGYGGNMGYVTPGAGQTSKTISITDDISVFGGPTGGVPPAELTSMNVIIPVPEPTSAILVVAGATSLLFTRRRAVRP